MIIDILPGRYYSLLIHVDIIHKPCGKAAGCISGLVWRMDNEPSKWRLHLCLHVHPDHSKQGSGSDRHHNMVFDGDEEEALHGIFDLLKDAALYGLDSQYHPNEPRVIKIQGDVQKLHDTLKKEAPDWIDFRVANIEDLQRYGLNLFHHAPGNN